MLSLVTFLCANAEGGIGKVLSLPDFNSGHAVWIVRAGVDFNYASGDYKADQLANLRDSWRKASLDAKYPNSMGFDASIGFNKSFGHHPLYWGALLGVGTRGCKEEYTQSYSATSSVSGGHDSHTRVTTYTLTSYNVFVNPTIGYKFMFCKNMALDVHVGGFFSYDFAGTSKQSVYNGIHNTSKYGNTNKDTVDEDSYKIGDFSNYNNCDAGVNAGVGYWYGHFNIDFTWQRGFIKIYDPGTSYYANKMQLSLAYAF